MKDAPLFAVYVTVAQPDAPACFTLRADFPDAIANQIQQRLHETWPMLDWHAVAMHGGSA